MKTYIEKFNESMKRMNKFPLVVRQLHKINTLENQVKVLEETIKDELYKHLMDKLGEPLEVERYKRENRRLRQQVKTLKEIVKEGK